MKLLPYLVLALLVAPILPTSLAQDLPPPNTAVLLKELDQIASGVQNKIQSRRDSALSQIQAASSSGGSAVDFYLHALENTKYRENHQEFVDWRRKNEELLRSISLQNAAQLQLRYLVLALQRSDKNDAFAQISQSLAYLNTLAALNSLNDISSASSDAPGENVPKNSQKIVKTTSSDKPYPEALALIQQPLNASSVVAWLQIADLLPKTDSFAPSPGNYQQIMEQNVRTPLRAKNDPRLPLTWDTQIAMESALATKSGSQQQADAFNQTRLPDLLFKKAKDTAAIGQPNRAIAEIIKLIQDYPADPDMKQWIDFARGLIASAVPTPTPAAQAPTPISSPFPLPAITPGTTN